MRIDPVGATYSGAGRAVVDAPALRLPATSVAQTRNPYVVPSVRPVRVVDVPVPVYAVVPDVHALGAVDVA
jgi:hypothetical protein